MIGYVCKYTPVELMSALGMEPFLISPSVTDFNEADTQMHPNICSYAKSVLEDIAEKDYDGVILTTCCDSIRRLYDTLCAKYPNKFFYLLDVPRQNSETSSSLYTNSLRSMIRAYEAFTGKPVEASAILSCLRELSTNSMAKTKEEVRTPGVVRLGLAGARYGASVRNVIENAGAEIVFDLTCTGNERVFPRTAKNSADEAQLSAVLTAYAKDLLNFVPCLRMIDASRREDILSDLAGKVDGVVYHTVKFCDSYSYEYATLHKANTVPLLKVETDLTRQCEGQIRTRVEAFVESLRTEPLIQKGSPVMTEQTIVMGVDSGSTSTNAVLINAKKEIIASSVVRTGAKSGESAEKVLEEVMAQAGITREGITLIVSTGYGRVSIPYADTNVTEISCHGKGARYFHPTVRTILDIGGQDSKAIRLNEQGEVTDFVMNDKCAAGTGRFLEAMARTLEIGIEELGPISLSSTEDVEISSMCTVFAESEVISLIAQNKEKSDIAHGVHEAIAGKAFSLLSRVGLTPDYMMTGGVAKNPGVVKAVEKKLKAPLFICPEPELVGAVGAALFGLESLS